MLTDFGTEVIWKNCEEHFQVCNRLAKPKHLQDNFSDLQEIIEDVQNCLNLKKNFQN
jgi:hypothetical protein